MYVCVCIHFHIILLPDINVYYANYGTVYIACFIDYMMIIFIVLKVYISQIIKYFTRSIFFLPQCQPELLKTQGLALNK